MKTRNCLRCKAKVEAYALKCHVCGFQFPAHKRENIEEIKYSYKFGKAEISNEITEVIKINVKANKIVFTQNLIDIKTIHRSMRT